MRQNASSLEPLPDFRFGFRRGKDMLLFLAEKIQISQGSGVFLLWQAMRSLL